MKFFSLPKTVDIWLLSLFVLFITWHPFYLHAEINLFEFGLYLPTIDAVFHGQIPYRDFFYLRGPFELYIPAGLMAIWGKNLAIMPAYFYAGTLITLIFCVLIGRKIFQSRLFLYLMVPVLIARAFPRVSFTIGGGLRFGLGLIAVFCVLSYLRKEKKFWLWLSGLFTAAALLTSIEIGVSSLAAVGGTLLVGLFFRREESLRYRRAFIHYMASVLIVVLPYLMYLTFQGALSSFFESMYFVLINMVKVFPETEVIPKNFFEFMGALVNPGHKNFRHLTPVYLYVFLAAYLLFKIRQRKYTQVEENLLCLGIYGIILYISIFRSLWGPAFEMALQPEKILLFALLERVYFFLSQKDQRARLRIKGQIILNLFLIGIILSSVGYAIQRYNKRFFAFKYVRNFILGKGTDSLKPLAGEEKIRLPMERLNGLVVPSWQAEDLNLLNDFVKSNTLAGEPILFYPELGLYNFIVDRPFVGRFPMGTLSWIGPAWHKEFMGDLKETRPPYIVMRKRMPDYFEKTNFIYPPNRVKYQEVMNYIQQNYQFVYSTVTLNIYSLKKE